jgi:TolA-binding protein
MTRQACSVALTLGALLLGAACATRAAAPLPPPAPPRAAEADRLPPPPAEPARPSVDSARILAELAELHSAVTRLVAESRRQDDHLAGLERRLKELAERRPAAGDVPPGFAPSGIGAAAPSSAPAPGTMASAADLYASGMARFRNRDYDTAILVLSELVSNYPTHPLRESAQVTVADIYYAQKDYRGAVAELERLLDAVPKGAKTPEVWVKIGLSRRHLGDEAGARKAWERVIADHGKTDAARQARDLLRSNPRS